MINHPKSGEKRKDGVYNYKTGQDLDVQLTETEKNLQTKKAKQVIRR